MFTRLDPMIVPKNGHTVRVIATCRVSDPRPGKQDERSLADQQALHEEWLKSMLGIPYELTVLEGRESGECIERKDFLQLTEMVGSGEYDLIITEDLGHILRRMHAHLFADRSRNRRKSRRHSVGKSVSVRAEPEELQLRHVPQGLSQQLAVGRM